MSPRREGAGVRRPRGTGRATGVLAAVVLWLLLLAGLALPAPSSAAPAASGTIVGQVVDDLGRPVAGAQVTVWATTQPSPVGPYGPSASVAFATTDALGRYVATDVPPRDDYVLFFTKDGYQPVDTHPASSRQLWRTFAVGAGQVVTEDIAMVELSVTVRGRIVDVAGHGIAGAETTFGITRADGTFEGRTVPGDSFLQASADGYVPLAAGRSPWVPDGRVRAERGQTVEGVVGRLRRVPTEDCWAQEGNWTPAGGFRDVVDANGNLTSAVATTPPQFPYADHLCLDTDDAAYRDREDVAVRVGVPMGALLRPAATVPAATSAARPATATPVAPVRAGTLRAVRRLKASRGTFSVVTRCTASCGGRVVATVRRAASRAHRASDVVIASGRVAVGTGTRNVRLKLTAAGRRSAARRTGVVATLRWIVPGASSGAAGPRVRVTAAR